MQDCNDYKPFDVLMMSSSIILDFCDDDDELFKKVLKAKKPTGIVFVFVFANKNAARPLSESAFDLREISSGSTSGANKWRQRGSKRRPERPFFKGGLPSLKSDGIIEGLLHKRTFQLMLSVPASDNFPESNHGVLIRDRPIPGLEMNSEQSTPSE